MTNPLKALLESAYINGATTIGVVAMSSRAVAREDLETTGVEKYTEQEWKTSDAKIAAEHVTQLIKDAFFDGAVTLGNIATSSVAFTREELAKTGLKDTIKQEWETSDTKQKSEQEKAISSPASTTPATLTLLSSEMKDGEHIISLQRADGKTIHISVPDDGYGEDTFTDKDEEKKMFGLNFVTNGHYA